MAELTNPHDRFFKEAMSWPEATRDFLQYYLPPAVSELLDVSSAEWVKDSFVDAELHEHFSDLLSKVDLRGGGEAYVYVLFEHKSHPEPLIAFQLLRYMVRVWEYTLRQGERLCPILPVVVYHGQARWGAPPTLQAVLDVPEAMRAYVPDYRYVLCDLSRYRDADLQGAVGSQAVFLVLKHIFSGDLRERLPEMARLWEELAQQVTGLERLNTILRYLATATDRVTEADLRQAVEAVFPEVGGGMMSTIAEKWVEQGMEKGLQQGVQQGLQQSLQQGVQQGLQQGMRQGLLAGIKLGLKRRFGGEALRLLPEIYKIEDVDVLEAVQEGIDAVTTLDELRRIYQPA
jgi:predicted transposase/invertase (TIGR01784 family)